MLSCLPFFVNWCHKLYRTSSGAVDCGCPRPKSISRRGHGHHWSLNTLNDILENKYRYIWLWSMPSSILFKWHTVRQKSEVDKEIRLSDKSLSIGRLIMQVIYHWAFTVAPALCPPCLLTLRSGVARAPPGYMVPAPLVGSNRKLVCD